MQKKNIFFILKFLSLFLTLSWITSITFVENIFIQLFMQISKLFLFLFNGAIIGNQIIIKGIYLEMIKECTGITMYVLFSAFAIAYDCPIKKKLKGLGIGLGILFSLNILRLFTIMLSAYLSTTLFGFIHDFLWPSTFFIFTLIVGAYYIKRCSK